VNKKLILLLTLISLIAMSIPLAYAGGPSEILTVWTDKTVYSPGQSGKITIAYNNLRGSPVTIRSITVIFKEWWAYDQTKNKWIGNITYTPSDAEKTVTERSVRVYEIAFSVPSDGRAVDTEVEIKVYTNLATPDEPRQKPEISVITTPVYWEQTITLLTVLMVLVIVCTVIIAATIFLSARRPQITWTTEEKPK